MRCSCSYIWSAIAPVGNVVPTSNSNKTETQVTAGNSFHYFVTILLGRPNWKRVSQNLVMQFNETDEIVVGCGLKTKLHVWATHNYCHTINSSVGMHHENNVLC